MSYIDDRRNQKLFGKQPAEKTRLEILVNEN